MEIARKLNITIDDAFRGIFRGWTRKSSDEGMSVSKFSVDVLQQSLSSMLGSSSMLFEQSIKIILKFKSTKSNVHTVDSFKQID